MSPRWSHLVMALTAVSVMGLLGAAVRTDEPKASPGAVMLIGGRHQDLSEQHRDLFIELAGGKNAKIVVIPTGVAEPELGRPDLYLTPRPDAPPLSFQVLHTRDRTTADDPAFVKPLTEATAVFFTNGHLHRLTDVYPGTLVEKELKKLFARGGLIAGTGSGASILGELVINRPHKEWPTGPGFGLLPKFVILDGDSERGRPLLLQALAANPDHVGLTVNPSTAVVVRDNRLRVVGEGMVDVRLAKGGGKEEKLESLKAGAELDLVELRREAASRVGKQRDDKPAAIVGTWKTIDRHVALGSLYQPVHGVRKRKATIQFRQDGDRLIGHAEGVGDRKDGLCEFRNVAFTDDRLTFEFDITWSKEHGPLAVEAGRLEDKGTVRMEATLKDGRLAGTWKMLLTDGTEVFRGEWEAERAQPPAPLAKPAGAAAEDAETVRHALAALRDAEPVIKVDETRPGKPVVSVHFPPNHGKVTDEELKQLRAFPHLRSLTVPNKPFVTAAGLAHLEGLEELEELTLNGTKATAEGIVRFLKGRTRMSRLELSGAPLRDDDLAALKNLTELRVLSLRGTLITDKGLVHLKPFTKLRALNLDTRDGQITDAALPHLTHLTELEDLDLDRTAITDAGLVHLKPLTKLTSLQFAFTSISDAGLEHLAGLVNLKGVNARGTKVTKEGVEKLQQKLPGVKAGYGPAVR